MSHPLAGSHSSTGASSFLKAGDAAVSRSEWRQAINLYSEAIAADGGAVLAFTKRAAAHSGMGDYRAALRDFSSALELDASSVSILLKRCDPPQKATTVVASFMQTQNRQSGALMQASSAGHPACGATITIMSSHSACRVCSLSVLAV